MPFGLMTVPATYQQLMFYRDFDKHVDQLDKVLTQLGSTGLKMKGSKCSLITISWCNSDPIHCPQVHWGIEPATSAGPN